MPIQGLKEILVKCQDGVQYHNKLLKALTKIYSSEEVEVFWQALQKCLEHGMLVLKREPAVERFMDFVAKFVTSLWPKTNPDQESEEDSDSALNPLADKIIAFLLEIHSARNKAIRFRVCQLITKLLAVQDIALEEQQFDAIRECMLQRCYDKVPLVRLHAVQASARLQNPTDANCPVIKAFKHLIANDPNPDVRRAVLQCIAPSTRTLACLIERAHDVNTLVRQSAYKMLAEKVHVRALSIAQRVSLMESGLKERAEGVRKACASLLLPAWLRGHQGDVQSLLHSLDVESSLETCQMVVSTLLKRAPLADAISNFSLLDENLLVPEDKLTCEAALYWRVLCQTVAESGPETSALLESLMPPCHQFCDYIKRLQKKHSEAEDDLDWKLQLEFVLQQLLEMVALAEMADQASRKALTTLLQQLFESNEVGAHMVHHLMPLMAQLWPAPDTLVTHVVEVVSGLRETTTLVDVSLSKEERRALDLKLAGVRVRLNQAREELEESVQRQDFSRAAELKAVVSQLEEDKASLVEASATHTKEVLVERNDPLTVLKRVTILAELMMLPQIKTLNPNLTDMMQSEIIPAVMSEVAEVRKTGMLALGLCCQLKQDIVTTYLPLLMQASQLDVETVRVTALKAVFDIVHIYGLNVAAISSPAPSQDEGEAGEEEEEEKEEEEEAEPQAESGSDCSTPSSQDLAADAAGLLQLLTFSLDCEIEELRGVAAEGMAKMLLSERIVSSKLLSHLVLLWFNPLTEDNNFLRHCLGSFFPIFAFAKRENQALIAEAFMPTIRTLLEAPTTSPLVNVDAANVANFLLQLTAAIPDQHGSGFLATGTTFHHDIAIQVCNEILSCPDSFNVKLWMQVLNNTDLFPDNRIHLQELAVLCDQMLEVVKNKPSVRSLVRFQTKVTQLLGSSGQQRSASHGNASDESEASDTEEVPPRLLEPPPTPVCKPRSSVASVKTPAPLGPMPCATPQSSSLAARHASARRTRNVLESDLTSPYPRECRLSTSMDSLNLGPQNPPPSSSKVKKTAKMAQTPVLKDVRNSRSRKEN